MSHTKQIAARAKLNGILGHRFSRFKPSLANSDEVKEICNDKKPRVTFRQEVIRESSVPYRCDEKIEAVT